MRRLPGMIVAIAMTTAFAAQVTVVTEDVPPYSYTENGNLVGMSTEVVRATLREAGLDYEIAIYPWARAYKMAQELEKILIYPIVQTPEREHQFKWVGAIAPRKSYFFKLRSRKDIQIHTLGDARRYYFGGVKDDARMLFLQQNGFEIKVISPKEELNIKQLAFGRIDLVIANEHTFTYKAKALGLDPAIFEKAYFLEEFSKRDFNMAFSTGTPDGLVEKCKKALEKIKASGEYDRIIERYPR